MKWIMTLTFATFAILVAPSQAHAMRVCLAENTVAEIQTDDGRLPILRADLDGDEDIPIDLAAFQCSSYRAVSKGLEVVDIGLTAATVYSACTDLAAPPKVFVTVSLGIGALVTKTAKFVVDQLPCDNTKDIEGLVEQVKGEVCQSLGDGGVKCAR